MSRSAAPQEANSSGAGSSSIRPELESKVLLGRERLSVFFLLQQERVGGFKKRALAVFAPIRGCLRVRTAMYRIALDL